MRNPSQSGEVPVGIADPKQLAQVIGRMAQVRGRVSSLLRDELDADSDVESLLAEHAKLMARAVNQLPLLHATDLQHLLPALRSALDEIHALCALIRVKLQLAGNDLRRSAELRSALRGYSRTLEGEGRQERGVLG